MSDQSQPVHPALEDILHRHANVNAFTANWSERLKRELFSPNFPDRATLFRRELAAAILHNTITPAEYERITGEDFDTQDELNQWLREIWRSVFGAAPIQAQ